MDPTARLETMVNKSLKKLQDMGRTTKKECWRMGADAFNISRFYGRGIPLRPIVSLPGSSTYILTKELSYI